MVITFKIMEINETIYVNNYLPYYPIYKDTLDDTLLRNKYEKINKNKEEYFKNAKIVNFDIIHNQCRKNSLQNSIKYYQTIKQDDLKLIRKNDEEQFISAAIKSRRDDVNVDRNVISEHFRYTTDLIKFKQKNKILLSSMHGKKKKREYDLAIMLYSHLKIK